MEPYGEITRVEPAWQPPGQAQPSAWPLCVGNATPSSLAVADERGMVVAGTFKESVRIGGHKLTATNGRPAGFVVALDRRGEARWAKAAVGNVIFSDLAADSDGFVYVAGRFAAATHCWKTGGDEPIQVARTICGQMARATFGQWTINAKSHGLFVAKLSPEGRFLWVAPMRVDGRPPAPATPAPEEAATSLTRPDRALIDIPPPGLSGGRLAVAPGGNVFVAGSVKGLATFGTMTTTRDTQAVFVARLDAAGHVSWVAFAPDRGQARTNTVTAMAATADEGVLVTGKLSTAISFGQRSLVPAKADQVLVPRGSNKASDNDLFIARLDREGNVRWARSAWLDGGSLTPNDLATDAEGSGYITGSARAFDPGVMQLGEHRVERVSASAFVAKIDENGRFRWVSASAGAPADGMALALDSEGEVLVTGALRTRGIHRATIFDRTMIVLDDRAAFLARVNRTGDLIWATGAHGASFGSAVATDSQGDVFVAGHFDQRATFDGVTVTPAVGGEMFVWKLAKP